ncbi:unnamed protein product, partial [Protopolystoma xenopodis]
SGRRAVGPSTRGTTSTSRPKGRDVHIRRSGQSGHGMLILYRSDCRSAELSQSPPGDRKS